MQFICSSTLQEMNHVLQTTISFFFFLAMKRIGDDCPKRPIVSLTNPSKIF